MSEYIVEASKLLDIAKNLGSEEKIVLNYFMDNISVGKHRALKELKAMSVQNPVIIIKKLSSLNLVEEKEECYNLAKPLREYILKRGRQRVI